MNNDFNNFNNWVINSSALSDLDTPKMAAFKAWNASRKQTLIEAASLCEAKIQREADYGGHGNFMDDKTGSECAKEIRGLI